MHVSLQRGRESRSDLGNVEAPVNREQKIVIRVQLLTQRGWQLVETDELVNLVELPLVPRAPRVHFLDELRDLSKDEGVCARAKHLAEHAKEILCADAMPRVGMPSSAWGRGEA